MVSTAKRTTKKATKKPQVRDTAKPDFAKARKAVDRLLEDNVDWLKAMAKR